MTSELRGDYRPLENMTLLLVMLHIAAEQGHSRLTRTQMHKFFFLTQRELLKKKIIATGFRFHKMPQGPWSTDIERSITALEKAGLIQTTTIPTLRGVEALMTKITPNGEQISEYEIEHMDEKPDSVILETVTKILEKYGNMDSASLADVTHGMRNLITRQLIDDIQMRKWVQKPLSETQAKMVYESHDDVEETFEIILNAKLREDIERSIEDAQKGRVRVLSSIDDLGEL